MPHVHPAAREPMTGEQLAAAGSPVKFLIVDDDQVSVMAIRRALGKLKIANPVFTATDGQNALELLRADIADGHPLPPYLVTLDLNMPRMNGLEFLAEVRRDPRLQRIVIFVLTTSDAPCDVASAYDNNIAGYILKDNAADSLSQALDMIESYSRIVVMPS